MQELRIRIKDLEDEYRSKLHAVLEKEEEGVEMFAQESKSLEKNLGAARTPAAGVALTNLRKLQGNVKSYSGRYILAFLAPVRMKKRA